MFVLRNFLLSMATVLDIALGLYMWVVIIRALISWVNPDPYNPIVRFLYNVTDPLLDRLRRLLPLQFGGVDLTPIVVILGIMFLKSFLVETIRQFAFHLA